MNLFLFLLKVGTKNRTKEKKRRINQNWEWRKIGIDNFDSFQLVLFGGLCVLLFIVNLDYITNDFSTQKKKKNVSYF